MRNGHVQRERQRASTRIVAQNAGIIRAAQQALAGERAAVRRLAENEEAHADEISALKREHAAEIATLKEEHESAVEQLRRRELGLAEVLDRRFAMCQAAEKQAETYAALARERGERIHKLEICLANT